MKIFIVIHQNQIEIMYKTYSIIGILFSVLLFAACSKHEPIIDGPETLPKEIYYIKNNTASDISVSGFKGICFYNYTIPVGKNERMDLVDADSAWVFVGERIVQKMYLKDTHERNFLSSENYSLLKVEDNSVSYQFTFEDSDINQQ